MNKSSTLNNVRTAVDGPSFGKGRREEPVRGRYEWRGSLGTLSVFPASEGDTVNYSTIQTADSLQAEVKLEGNRRSSGRAAD